MQSSSLKRIPHPSEGQHVHHVAALGVVDLDVADDTMIWFCSDNGPEGKDGKAPGSTGGLRGRKRSLYEGGTRVPAFAVWPGHIQAGVEVRTLACTSDYLPTVAGWLQLPLPTP